VTANCRDCRFFVSEPAALERALPGFNILSSAFGAVRAGTALCTQGDRFIVAAPACTHFLGKTSGTN
jgi:hypothetical protein